MVVMAVSNLTGDPYVGTLLQLASSSADRIFPCTRYWLRAPTGEQWVVQTIMDANQDHGSGARACPRLT